MAPWKHSWWRCMSPAAPTRRVRPWPSFRCTSRRSSKKRGWNLIYYCYNKNCYAFRNFFLQNPATCIGKTTYVCKKTEHEKKMSSTYNSENVVFYLDGNKQCNIGNKYSISVSLEDYFPLWCFKDKIDVKIFQNPYCGHSQHGWPEVPILVSQIHMRSGPRLPRTQGLRHGYGLTRSLQRRHQHRRVCHPQAGNV
jgi:hypothetical protein